MEKDLHDFEREIWGRITEDRTRTLRAERNRLLRDIEIIKRFINRFTGERPVEKTKPPIRRPDSAYGER